MKLNAWNEFDGCHEGRGSPVDIAKHHHKTTQRQSSVRDSKREFEPVQDLMLGALVRNKGSLLREWSVKIVRPDAHCDFCWRLRVLLLKQNRPESAHARTAVFASTLLM